MEEKETPQIILDIRNAVEMMKKAHEYQVEQHKRMKPFFDEWAREIMQRHKAREDQSASIIKYPITDKSKSDVD